MKLSIIILSYNTAALLKECLNAIFTKLETKSFEVIVLDNASHDDSVKMVQKEFPQVKILQSDTNLGFGKGLNKASQSAKGEYLLFLNSDAQILSGNIADIDAFFTQHLKIGVIGGRLQNTDGSYQRSFSNFYHLKKVFTMLVFGDQTETGAIEAVQKVDWVTGGCMFIRRELFQKVRGFDPYFFMYIEDMELCFRVAQEGISIYYYPFFVVQHLGQGSSNRDFAIQQIYRGLPHFYAKHKNSVEYFIVKLLLISKALLLLCAGYVTGRRHLVTTYSKALQLVV